MHPVISKGDDFDTMRQVIRDPRVNKKNFAQFTTNLSTRVKQLKTNIMALKKKLYVTK